MGQSRRSKHQNTARNKHYIIAKSRRFCRDSRRILRVKNWRRSENFDKVGILRICGVTARSHIRLPTSTFTRCKLHLQDVIQMRHSWQPIEYSVHRGLRTWILQRRYRYHRQLTCCLFKSWVSANSKGLLVGEGVRRVAREPPYLGLPRLPQRLGHPPIDEYWNRNVCRQAQAYTALQRILAPSKHEDISSRRRGQRQRSKSIDSP